MAHVLTGQQPKKINLEKGVFESNGTFYYVHHEAMGYARLKRFYELLPVVVYGRKYTDLLSFIHNLRLRMTTGTEDFKSTYFHVATELTNWDQYLIDNASEFVESHIDDVLRFCALFMVTKEENMTVVDDILVEEKISNWKKDMHIPDFFLASKQFVPQYKDLLTKLWAEMKEKGGSLKGSMPPD